MEKIFNSETEKKQKQLLLNMLIGNREKIIKNKDIPKQTRYFNTQLIVRESTSVARNS